MAKNNCKPLFSVTIKDCEVQTFTVGGHGGSGKDTSNTGVRILHKHSGAVGRAVDTRSQQKNKELAFRRMAESKTFQSWAKLRASLMTEHKSIDERVEELMQPDNLKVEYRTQKGWIVPAEGE